MSACSIKPVVILLAAASFIPPPYNSPMSTFNRIVIILLTINIHRVNLSCLHQDLKPFQVIYSFHNPVAPCHHCLGNSTGHLSSSSDNGCSVPRHQPYCTNISSNVCCAEPMPMSAMEQSLLISGCLSMPICQPLAYCSQSTCSASPSSPVLIWLFPCLADDVGLCPAAKLVFVRPVP